jgi:hypothetical protein
MYNPLEAPAGRPIHPSPDAGSNFLVRAVVVAGLVAALGATTGCVSAAPRSFAPSGVPESASDIAVRRISADAALLNDSGMLDSARIVVRNEQQWREIWSRLAAGKPQSVSPPSVDFGREMVLVATLGSHRAGHSIRVQKVSNVGGVLYAEVMSRAPGDHCSTVRQVSNTITAPADLVVVPATKDPVAFVERRGSRTC